MYAPNAGPYDTLTPENAVVLLIDHQVGLMQLIDDMAPETAKSNVLGLARAAKGLGIPVILTTSRDWGPNGALISELSSLFPDTEVIRRPGVINAYRWPAFREALEATGRKKVIIAGVTDSTCLSFPSLDMILDGYEVHAVVDASGAEAPGQIVRDAVVANLSRAGVNIKSWFGVVAELIADWRRDEARGWPLAAGAVHDHLPSWGYLLDTDMAYGSGRMTPPEWFREGQSEPTSHIQALGTPEQRGYPLPPCVREPVSPTARQSAGGHVTASRGRRRPTLVQRSTHRRRDARPRRFRPTGPAGRGRRHPWPYW